MGGIVASGRLRQPQPAPQAGDDGFGDRDRLGADEPEGPPVSEMQHDVPGSGLEPAFGGDDRADFLAPPGFFIKYTERRALQGEMIGVCGDPRGDHRPTEQLTQQHRSKDAEREQLQEEQAVDHSGGAGEKSQGEQDRHTGRDGKTAREEARAAQPGKRRRGEGEGQFTGILLIKPVRKSISRRISCCLLACHFDGSPTPRVRRLPRIRIDPIDDSLFI